MLPPAPSGDHAMMKIYLARNYPICYLCVNTIWLAPIRALEARRPLRNRDAAAGRRARERNEEGEHHGRSDPHRQLLGLLRRPPVGGAARWSRAARSTS